MTSDVWLTSHSKFKGNTVSPTFFSNLPCSIFFSIFFFYFSFLLCIFLRVLSSTVTDQCWMGQNMSKGKRWSRSGICLTPTGYPWTSAHGLWHGHTFEVKVNTPHFPNGINIYSSKQMLIITYWTSKKVPTWRRWLIMIDHTLDQRQVIIGSGSWGVSSARNSVDASLFPPLPCIYHATSKAFMCEGFMGIAQTLKVRCKGYQNNGLQRYEVGAKLPCLWGAMPI